MKTLNNIFLALFTLVCLSYCASSKSSSPYTTYKDEGSTFPKNVVLNLKVPDDVEVSFQGMASYDSIRGSTAQPTYVVPNAGGLVAAVITHAMVEDSAVKARKAKLHEEADKILVPYLDSIHRISYDSLLLDIEPNLNSGISLKRVNIDAKLKEGDWIIESQPNYFMLQDEGAILLKNIVSIYQITEKENKIVYQNIIDVISPAYQGKEPQAYWNKNNGDKLKNTSKSLLQSSLKLALNDANNKSIQESEMQQTFRFYQNGETTYERGYLILANKERLTIRTLRGWIKSVPIIAVDDEQLEKLEGELTYLASLRGIGVIYRSKAIGSLFKNNEMYAYRN